MFRSLMLLITSLVMNMIMLVSSYFCSRGHGISHANNSHVNLVFVRYFDVLYVVFPLVVLCERRLHDTSPVFGPRGRHWEVVSR